MKDGLKLNSNVYRYLVVNVVVVLEPVRRVGRIDEPVDINTIVVGHEWRVIQDGGQKVDSRNGGQQ